MHAGDMVGAFANARREALQANKKQKAAEAKGF